MRATAELCLSNHFEQRPVTTLRYRNRLCWSAREVGAAIGYSRQGKRFASQITGGWAEDFVEGHDYAVLAGAELEQLRAVAPPGTELVPGRTAHLLLLFEPGLHMALMRTRKPAGRKLRRWLAEEVLPQLLRTGRYEPDADANTDAHDEALVPAASSPEALQLAIRREDRLDRQMKREALEQLVAGLDALDLLDPAVGAGLLVSAAEEATGQSLGFARPTIEDDWLSPTQMGERFGVTSQRIGHTISALELRGKLPGLCRPIPNKARHCDRAVVTYLYSPEAVDRIEARLRADGHIGA